MLITHADAITLKLKNCDVFKRSHLFYMKGINRAVAVAELNYEAYKAFSETTLFKEHANIINEEKELENFHKSGKSIGADEYPWPKSLKTFGSYRNLEYLKIGYGFELSLKSKLLDAGYVIHEIDSSDPKYAQIAKKQKKTPIKVDELMSISGYMFNGEQNILPGITSKSIAFSIILEKNAYVKVYTLNNKSLQIIRDYKDLRNTTHLPGDAVETKALSLTTWEDKISFLRNYVNDHIVEHNRVILKSLNYPDSLLNIPEWSLAQN